MKLTVAIASFDFVSCLLCFKCHAWSYIATSACQSASRDCKSKLLSSKLTSLKCTTAGTPYEDGTFRMKMILGPDFPNTPPKGTLTHFSCLELVWSVTWSNQDNTGACLQSALLSAIVLPCCASGLFPFACHS